MDEAMIRERCEELVAAHKVNWHKPYELADFLVTLYRAAYADGQRAGYPAIRLVRIDNYACVHVEVAGQWVEVIRAFYDAPFSHIVESAGISAAIRQAAGEVK